MNASMAGSRAIFEDLGGTNWVTETLSGSTRFLQDDAQQRDIGLGPADDATRRPTRSSMLLIFRRRLFLRALAASPEGAHSATSSCAGWQRDGRRGHLQVAARNREIGFAVCQQGDAFSCTLGLNRREPDRTLLAAKVSASAWISFWFVACRRADRDLQGYRPQREIQPRRRRQTAAGRRQGSAAAVILRCGGGPKGPLSG